MKYKDTILLNMLYFIYGFDCECYFLWIAICILVCCLHIISEPAVCVEKFFQPYFRLFLVTGSRQRRRFCGGLYSWSASLVFRPVLFRLYFVLRCSRFLFYCFRVLSVCSVRVPSGFPFLRPSFGGASYKYADSVHGVFVFWNKYTMSCKLPWQLLVTFGHSWTHSVTFCSFPGRLSVWRESIPSWTEEVSCPRAPAFSL